GAPVEVDAVDVGGHEEQVRAYVLGEHLAGQVLVDDGFGVGQDARCRGGADGGNASAACADDHGPVVKQPGDGLDLQDLLRFGRGNHAAPGGTVAAEDPASLGGQRVGGVPVVDGADERGRAGECRVIGVHGD